MNFNEKTISKEYIFKGEVINMRVDTITTPFGNTATRELVEHPGGVCVVALDENGCVIMEKQYRRPFDTVLFEIPAGKLFLGEDPFECGKREFEEETGMCAKKYTNLGEMYSSPGFCNEIIYMYLAQDLYEGKENPDDDELIETSRVPLGKLVQMILSGEIKDSKTCIAIMKVNELKNRGMV